MAVGVWDPSGGQDESKAVTVELMQRFSALASSVDESVSQDDLESAGVAGESWVMTLEAAAWAQASQLETTDLEGLARLFTIVEQQVSGWDAGKKSPVIPIVKVLKQREAFTPELRKWIKSHTDNRYLPNGSAL